MSHVTELEVELIRTALRKMKTKGYFDICTIDAILKITGGIPNSRDYDQLRLLHCVHYSDMSPKLAQSLPAMIKKVIESPTFEFEFVTRQEIQLNVIENTNVTPIKSFLERFK